MYHAKAAGWAVLVGSMIGSVAVLSQAATVSGAPIVLSRAVDQGPVERSSRIDFTVWLNLRDDAGLETSTQAAREGGAGWLSQNEIDARHSPSAASIATVSQYLKSRGFSVGTVGPGNLFVKASGTADAVQHVFGVELHQYNLNGRNFRANTAAANVPQEIKSLVASVGGLNTLGATPNAVRALAHPARPGALRPGDAEGVRGRLVKFGARSNGLFFSPQCFNGVITESFSGGGATATYSGTRYGTDINNSTPGTLSPCGYQPSDMATAYNLSPLYKAGLDGSGTTVAITDAFGSTTVAADLATFSAAMGLPPASITIIGTPTESGFSGTPNSGWADETTLDVEWVHAVAPGAKILLVIAPTNNDSDLLAAIATAAATPGVAAISNSWSEWESFTDIPSRAAYDGVLKLANARGIAVNFATGDSGNETVNLGYADVNYPASSPYATGIGGVSVVLDSRQHVKLQTSWGNNLTEVADTIALGSPPVDPPFNEGFVFGGGGGVSNVYALPSYQHGLTGHRRLVPDISWVADPYTGVEVIETVDAAGDQSIFTIGGTSLATPMFSGIWGIATQYAHHKLGQAAPYLYSMPAGAITDVGAANSPDNVTGAIGDSNGTQNYTASALALPLQGQDTFISTLYNSPYSTRWFVLTFGTDSGLEAGPGWDQATGVGTPNGWNFVHAFGREH